ncbi:MAG TPA: YdeI/OmpD-associated family protein [Candidatus Acidoferrales bacterium]|jgi:uncharacterized protein YdeI (YjbR/CyaY-like superfamily)|nr:YdeI/OmpD-associated family protein [Candidatus Acidoferrales bacterium]
MKQLGFKSAAALHAWLTINHDKCDGIWLRLFKKDSGKASVTYAEALDQALCFGWIDGQVKSLDELSWVQKFTPRRARSRWSKRNTEHVERLGNAGMMMPAGLLAVEAAKADGRWHTAYDSPRNAKPPEDFLKALGKDKKAKAFFETLNRANVYAIVYRLQTAKKPETRARRMETILAMLGRGETYH